MKKIIPLFFIPFAIAEIKKNFNSENASAKVSIRSFGFLRIFFAKSKVASIDEDKVSYIIDKFDFGAFFFNINK